MKRLAWIQGATCNGNAHSFLNYPLLQELLEALELLYHPVLPSRLTLPQLWDLEELDILVVEGGLREGFQRAGFEVNHLIHRLYARANWVVCVGSCAVYGGLFGDRGVAFAGEEPTELKSDKVINIPGCPAHPEWIATTLWALVEGRPPLRDTFLRPKEFFAYTVHAGCTRNEYFEWKVDARGFGFKEGCLFYEQGCQGPYTHGSCNKILWNQESSKPRIGTPCFGCTEPDFPKENLFRTKTYMGIPASLPLGVSKRAYLTLTGVAKSFKIQRLLGRLFED
ncbi:MAG: hydrogenase [Epsilonproteobacteria bacterium]|nr:hydrogenase [Nitratiruptor sp.]MRJ02883.1 hydrogenase [Campylobacterota bacterium]NPA82976.1 hydrogenase [Campylobacterota bacterium]